MESSAVEARPGSFVVCGVACTALAACPVAPRSRPTSPGLECWVPSGGLATVHPHPQPLRTRPRQWLGILAPHSNPSKAWSARAGPRRDRIPQVPRQVPGRYPAPLVAWQATPWHCPRLAAAIPTHGWPLPGGASVALGRMAPLGRGWGGMHTAPLPTAGHQSPRPPPLRLHTHPPARSAPPVPLFCMPRAPSHTLLCACGT